jgi:iron complex transport system ATP-binding protein
MSLDAENLSVRYGASRTRALDGVSCTVARPSQITALVGPNGSGKSTLLRCLAGAQPPTGGRATLDGDDLRRLRPPALARRLAFVPQTSPIGFAFTVRELAALGNPDPEQVEQALRAMDLWDLADRSLLTLSGGEQQRAAIARALAQDTPYLLLDEPTAHLDLRHQTQVLRLARHLAHEKGSAVLIVLHDLNQASAYADALVLLQRGQVVAAGDVSTVLKPDILGLVYQTSVYTHAHPITNRPWVTTGADEPVPKI